MLTMPELDTVAHVDGTLTVQTLGQARPARPGAERAADSGRSPRSARSMLTPEIRDRRHAAAPRARRDPREPARARGAARARDVLRRPRDHAARRVRRDRETRTSSSAARYHAADARPLRSRRARPRSSSRCGTSVEKARSDARRRRRARPLRRLGAREPRAARDRVGDRSERREARRRCVRARPAGARRGRRPPRDERPRDGVPPRTPVIPNTRPTSRGRASASQVAAGDDQREAAHAERATVEELPRWAAGPGRARSSRSPCSAPAPATAMPRAGTSTPRSRSIRRCPAALAARAAARDDPAMTMPDIEDRLHARDRPIEAELVAIALEQTGAEHGALFVWDKEAAGLALVHHVVSGVTVTLPRVRRARDGEQAGIALHVFDTERAVPVARHLARSAVHALPHRRRLDRRGADPLPAPADRRAHGLDARAARRSTRDAARARPRSPRSRRRCCAASQVDKLSRAATGRPLMIKGLSPAWHEVERKLELAAPTNAPILIRGESGTGKDLVARAIHWNSRARRASRTSPSTAPRSPRRCSSRSCSVTSRARSPARASTRSASSRRPTAARCSSTRSASCRVMLQAKVLRAVEQGEVQPLGSNEPPDRVDVRLICATNRDLEAMAKTGAFRDDLFYRLSVMTLELPPLRSYKDNLEMLANVFLEQSARRARQAGAAPRRPTCSRASPRTTSRATCASSRTRSSTRSSCAPATSCASRTCRARSQDPRRRSSAPPKPAAAHARRGARDAGSSRSSASTSPSCSRSTAATSRSRRRPPGINTVTLYRLLKRRGLHLGRTVKQG